MGGFELKIVSLDTGCMMLGLYLASTRHQFTRASKSASHTQLKENKMRKILMAVLMLLLALQMSVTAQNANSSSTTESSAQKTNASKKRGPVFRANKDQIKQAQAILKARNFYTGEQTGKLDDATRAGLKEYQKAEGIKVTGTLNKLTLEKMNITLTDKQKAM
jgi:hypothetical protein